MYNTMTTINNTTLCTENLQRVDFQCSYHTLACMCTHSNHEVMNVLISLIVGIISQFIRTSKHHIVLLKYTQFLLVNYTLNKAGKKESLLL